MVCVSEARWTVVMPVKRLPAAKSRLRGALPGVPHEELALALATDTLRAVRACPAVAGVLVVTDDPRVTASVQAAGARVAGDPGGGLNAAFRHGAAVAGPRAAVAGLTADLPALRPAELAAALRATRGVRGFVADAPGGGTVLLAAPAGAPLAPRFGPGSAAAHAASGALPLAGEWPSLRRDVDTPADLADAAGLGVGPRTAALLARVAAAVEYGAGMQGTVATYDASTRSGVLLLDDGTELAFPARAFDASGLRLLRLGQRVRIERDADGEVVRVTLPTMA
ncbi:2-phospho-L-lactate guanylyltransferase [Micromonospora tulbaghiae]|uniref:Phosphoenolpyruvate guanylyltransferase n=1 Tax=Micromonospora tulbaghiae TaxID=479978 RepID=A0AAW4JN02_9ACTN|nr:2-phospho-L-lactate guanylyltransferase [Micromonospora tulbaghiae]